MCSITEYTQTQSQLTFIVESSKCYFSSIRSNFQVNLTFVWDSTSSVHEEVVPTYFYYLPFVFYQGLH